jgi:F420-dependent oxidoreductase-like protein
VKVGVIVPQGWTGEYDGWDPATAWQRSLAVAQEAEEAGFESLWCYDHVHTTPDPTDEITFESFTTLAAVAARTERVRLGHIVMCASFRNPALMAKMISTLDVISGGRMELGIGAGWKEEEWLAYGYEFPPVSGRQAMLRDALEIARRMFEPGRATYEGERASVQGAINVPKPLQGRLPIMVGGNGRKVTWGLAARHADELNLDAVAPGALPEALEVIRQRCEEAGRDPDTLRVSVHLWLRDRAWLEGTGEQDLPMPDLIHRYVELGVSRVMGLVPGCADDPEAIARFAEDARAAGAELSEPALAV